MTSSVQTVLGPVEPGRLGRVLPHEHLTSLVPGPWLAADDPADDPAAYAADQVRHAVDALKGLRARGYDTVVDVSPYGVVGRAADGGNLGILERASRESGVHVVLGTSVYLASFSPEWTVRASLDDLTARFVADVEEGIGPTPYRAGVLGEQATGLDVISPHEEKCLRAAVRAQAATGVALMTHTTHGTMAFEQVAIIRQEGGDLSRTVIGHMDIQPDLDYVVRLLDTGVSIAFDTIGKQLWDFVVAPLPADLGEGEFTKRAYHRSDATRAARVVELVERGYGTQLILSMDLTGAEVYLNPSTHGQWGYRYLDAVFLPACRERGLPESWAETLVRDNPLRLLARVGA